MYSILSYIRAKTNKASLPEKCNIPIIALIGNDFVILNIIIPASGGSPIKQFSIEAMDLTDDTTIVTTLQRNQSSDIGSEIQCRISNLKPNVIYIYRCRAESLVGNGIYSEWTSEIKIPANE